MSGLRELDGPVDSRGEVVYGRTRVVREYAGRQNHKQLKILRHWLNSRWGIKRVTAIHCSCSEGRYATTPSSLCTHPGLCSATEPRQVRGVSVSQVLASKGVGLGYTLFGQRPRVAP